MTAVSYDDYLAHYGVKGMKWGKRGKAETKSQSDSDQAAKPKAAYGSKSQMVDAALFGNGGPKRIQKRIDKGNSLRKARVKEVGLHASVGAAAAAAIWGGPTIARATTASLHTIADNKRKADAGRAAASKFSDSRGINNFQTIDLKQGPDGRWR